MSTVVARTLKFIIDLMMLALSVAVPSLTLTPIAARVGSPRPSLSPRMMAASPELYLGIDAGTQSVKALLYDTSTKRVVGRE